jgi:hypothetical protein
LRVKHDDIAVMTSLGLTWHMSVICCAEACERGASHGSDGRNFDRSVATREEADRPNFCSVQ